MALSILALLSLTAAGEPPQTAQTEPYQPVAYERPAVEGEVEKVTLSLGDELLGPQQPAPAPQKVRQSSYVSRGQMGLGDGNKNDKSGFRVELRTGWDRITLGAVGDDDRSDGLLFGLATGYDHAVTDRFFVGAFAGINASTARTSGTVATSPDPLSGTIIETHFETEVASVAEIGLRAGWWVREGMNVFAEGALTQLSVDVDSETRAITPVIGLPNPVVSEPFYASDSETVTGWRLGAGTEAQLTDSLYTTARYRFTFYDEDDAGAETEQFEILTGVGLRF